MTNGDEARAEETYRQAVVLYQRGQLDEAQHLCEQSLRRQPGTFDALHLLGIIAIQRNRPQQAVEFIDRAVSINPRSASAHNNRGNALLELGQCEAAIASYDTALSLEPRLADAHYNRGNAFFDLNRHDAAFESYSRAIECESSYWRAHNNCGLVLWCQKQPAAALAHYDKAIAIEPNNPEAYKHRGDALRDLGEFTAAIASYDTATAIAPGYAEACIGRGSALAAINRYEAALESYAQAIAARGDFAEAYLNSGNVLVELGRSAEAAASYDAAIALNPEFAEAHYKLGDVQRNLGLLEAAVASYDRALAIKPDLKFLRGTRLHAKMQLCDWRNFDAEVAELAACIERGEAACPPFALLALSGSASLQRRAAQIYVREECPPNASLPSIPRRNRREKISVGYFSADFCNHPVAYLTAALFEAHDRSAFEVSAFSTGTDTQDEMRKRLEQGFDQFLDVRRHSDRDIALLARTMEVDIAVDLGGFTSNAKPALFAMRAAPVQIGYVGYLGTTAAPYMDYLMADRTIVPPEHREHYAEKMLYLPSYQSNDPRRAIADRAFTRAELGLPPSGFVFCCFNSPYKITPATFGGWMRILERVPESVLLLYAGNAAVANNLRAEALRAGIDSNRLVFGKALPRPEYMARYRAADLFLDTLPYNAGTTASDALWAGLPVLTCVGEAFAGRMAASLLTAVGIPELIASSQEHYETLAVELALDRPRLSEIGRRLREQRQVAPLFDVGRFVKHLEAAYRRIYERYHAGLAPEDIDCGVGS